MDEAVTVRCPQCGQDLKAPAEVAGKTVKCPACGTAMRVPEAGGRQPAAQLPPVAGTGEALPSAQSPPPPQTAPFGVAPDVARANRLLAGKPCPVCQREVLLGEEVVKCIRCGTVSHHRCWQQRGGCAAAACTTAQAAPQVMAVVPQALPVAAQTMPCRACAEPIPVNVAICPYCAEPVAGPAAAVHGPTSFEAKRGFATWTVANQGLELVARGRKPGQEVRARRENAPHEVALKPRRLIITQAGKRWKFNIGEIGYATVEYWLNGYLAPRRCRTAKDALTTAIVGIFIFQPILGISAICSAGKAQRLIDQYPQVFTGRGMASAARVIGIIDVVLGVIGILARVSQMS